MQTTWHDIIGGDGNPASLSIQRLDSFRFARGNIFEKNSSSFNKRLRN